MSEANVKIRVATDEKIDSHPIEEGLLLLNKDSHSISFDWDGERKIYSDTISVETIEELKAIESPIKGKLYFVENSERFYKYSNGVWSTFDSSSDFLIVDELPEIGEDGKFYVYNNIIYRYDVENKKYIPLSGGTSAETEEKLEVIDAEILLLKKTVTNNNTTIEQIQQTIVSNENGIPIHFF